MKKIKWTIMTAAVLFSVCAAFATRPKFDCTQATQYWYNGSGYAPAGTYGENFVCTDGTGTCSYYTTNGGQTYLPCMEGTFEPIDEK
jgi:hypothetical protein